MVAPSPEDTERLRTFALNRRAAPSPAAIIAEVHWVLDTYLQAVEFTPADLGDLSDGRAAGWAKTTDEHHLSVRTCWFCWSEDTRADLTIFTAATPLQAWADHLAATPGAPTLPAPGTAAHGRCGQVGVLVEQRERWWEILVNASPAAVTRAAESAAAMTLRALAILTDGTTGEAAQAA